MAVYLFVLLTLQLVFDLGKLVWTEGDIPKRAEFLIGMGIELPPYIWFGWYSNLVF